MRFADGIISFGFGILVAVASLTGQSKIVSMGVPAAASWDDMFD
jgi:hypothetical protein